MEDFYCLNIKHDIVLGFIFKWWVSIGEFGISYK